MSTVTYINLHPRMQTSGELAGEDTKTFKEHLAPLLEKCGFLFHLERIEHSRHDGFSIGLGNIVWVAMVRTNRRPVSVLMACEVFRYPIDTSGRRFTSSFHMAKCLRRMNPS